MKKLSLFIMFGFLICGCATVTREQMEKDTSNFTLPHKPNQKLATVYIVRPEFLGALIRFNVFLDDQNDESEMGWTKGTQHIYFYVTPGKHTIYSKAENWAQTTINAHPGEILFIRQDPSMGFLIAQNSILSIDAVEGRYHVLKTERGEILKFEKAESKKTASNR